jgi:hypothetical protein
LSLDDGMMKNNKKDNYLISTAISMFIILAVSAMILSVFIMAEVGRYSIDSSLFIIEYSECETAESHSETSIFNDTTTTYINTTTEDIIKTETTQKLEESYFSESIISSNTTEFIKTDFESTTTITSTYEETSTNTITSLKDLSRLFVKSFSRGTYYCYGCPKVGGSGRSLISCDYGDGDVKGSIASSYLYNNYGYLYNGNRSKFYIECPDYPEMNGYYYLDDSDAGNSEVIDFFYINSSGCPFHNVGVINVNVYIYT